MRTFLIVIFVFLLPSCSGREQPVDSRLSSPRESGDLPHSISDPTAIRDTVVEKRLFLGESFSVGRMIWMVDVTQPNDHVEWSMCAIVDDDTAFLHKGNSGWFKPAASRPDGGPDSTSQKVPWYTRDFFEFQRDSIPVSDPRRRIAQRFPDKKMARYLQDHGMSPAAANQAERAFWDYYEHRPIITFRFPEFPLGGDQRNFAYHPTVRWFLPVSMP